VNTVVNLNGGLGNQLFQICFARSRTRTLGNKTIVTQILKNNQFNRSLYDWAFEESEWFRYLNFSSVKYPDRYPGKINRFIPFYHPKFNISLKGIETFRLPIYRENYRQFVYEFLLTKQGEIEDILKWINSLLSESTKDAFNLRHRYGISVHARRGDYVSNLKTRHFHGYCGMDYFKNNIRYLSDLGYSKDGILISSDDFLFAKEIALFAEQFSNKVDIIEDQDPQIVLLKLTSSFTFIGSNSTFSFWAANLAAKDKVILPLKWFRSGKVKFDPHYFHLGTPELIDFDLEY
jgi:hypothetical protein